MKVYELFEVEYIELDLIKHLVALCATQEVANRELARLEAEEPDIEYEILEIAVIED